MERIDYNFQQFAKSSMMSRLGTNVRGKDFDACAREYIATHDQPIIVLLGCGLGIRNTV